MKQITKDNLNSLTFFNYQFSDSQETTYFFWLQKQASTFYNYFWQNNTATGYYRFAVSATTIAGYNVHSGVTTAYPILSLEGGTYNLEIYTGSSSTIQSQSIDRGLYTKVYEEELQVHPINERVAIKFNPNPCIECLDVDITTLNNGQVISVGAGGSYTCDNRDVTITHTSGATITTIAPGGTYQANDADVTIIHLSGGPNTLVSPGGNYTANDADATIIHLSGGPNSNVSPSGTFTCNDAPVTIIHTSGGSNSSVAAGGTYTANDAPVLITDTDSIIYSAYPGSTFTCTVSSSGISTATTTFEFGVGYQNKQMGRIGTTFTATSISTSNVSAYQVWKNNVEITSYPTIVNQNDRIYVAVTATTSSSTRSVTWNCEGISNPITYTANTYFYPRTTIFTEEVIQLPFEYYETDNAYYADNPTVNWYGNYIASDPLVDNFEVIIPPNTPLLTAGATVFGLNDQTVSNTVAGRPNRTKYFFGLLPGVWQVYEFNVLKSQLSFGNTASTWFKIAGAVTGATGNITFYRSTDNGSSWTLLYTSLTTYSAGTKFYYDFQHVGGANTWTRFMPSRLREL